MRRESVGPPAEPTDEDLFPTAIVAPNPLLCESLSRFLKGTVFDIVAHASSAGDLDKIDLPDDQPILAIFDGCDQPSDFCEHIARFFERYPAARIVVLANSSSAEEVAHVIRSGAHGYFATISTREDFIKSLELVMSGQTVLPSEGVSAGLLSEADTAGPGAPHFLGNADAAPDQPALPQFSDRELSILRCLVDGSSNKVIARECDIAEGTVKVHVKAILRKIKVSNRTQAAIWALNNAVRLWTKPIHPAQAQCRHAAAAPSRLATAGEVIKEFKDAAAQIRRVAVEES